MRFSVVVAAGALVLGAIISNSDAQTLHWDIDTIDQAGAGGATPAGTWDTGTTPNWNVNSDGTGVPGLWTDNADAVFSAGTDATGTATVTLTSPVNANSIAVEEGTIQFATGTLTLTGSGTFDVAAGATASFTGTPTLAGTVGVKKNGDGTLLLGSSEAYSTASGAQLTVNAGIADFAGDTALGIAPGAARNNAVTINGGTLRYSGTGSLALNANRGVSIGANGGTIEVPKLAAISGLSLANSSSMLSGAGILTKAGAGRLTLTGTQTGFTGKYRVLGGILNSNGDGRYGAIPGSVVPDYFFLDGGGLRIAVTSGVTINANRGITLGANGGKLAQPAATGGVNTLTYNGIIAGTAGGGLTIDWQDTASTTSEGGAAGGIVVLGGANTYDGGTTINSGATLRVGAAGAIPDTSVITTMTASSATFDLSTNSISETVKSIAGTSGTMLLGAASTLTLGNPAGEVYNAVLNVADGGKIIKDGAGAITLGGGNNNATTGFRGEFILNSGTLGVGNGNMLGGANTPTAKITINGGNISNNDSAGRTINAAVTVNLNADFSADDSLFSGPGQVLINGPATINGGDRTITVNGTANLGLADLREDVAGRKLIKKGAGTLALTGANVGTAFTGDVTVEAGRLQVSGTSIVGTGNNIINLSGGALNSSANRDVIANPVTNPINLTTDSAITTTSANTTVNMNLASSSIGGTAGTLTFRNDGANDAADQFEPRFSASNLTFDRPIVIDNGAVGLTRFSSFNTTGSTQTYTGIISGNGKFARRATGPTVGGTTILTAANTYSGGTDVYDGVLQVNASSGTGSGPVTVGDGTPGTLFRGTLAGTASIAGLITVQEGGAIAPGASIGTLTAAGGLTLQPLSNLKFELGAPGTSDKIDVTLANGFTINGGTVDFLDAGGLAAGTYTIVDYAGTLGGAFGNLALGLTQPPGFTFQLVDNAANTSIDLQVAVGTPGDFNSDGKVNAADYVLWRKDPNSYGGPGGYSTWRQNFGDPPGNGNALGNGGTVPEPGAVALLLMGVLAVSPLRRRSPS